MKRILCRLFGHSPPIRVGLPFADVFVRSLWVCPYCRTVFDGVVR